MTKKFDPKTFKGRRVYTRVRGAANVERVWVWDALKGEYRPPERGSLYRARRWEVDDSGKQVRRAKYFDTFEEARDWKAHLEQPAAVPAPESPADLGPPLGDVIDDWKRRRWPSLAASTKETYEKHLRLYFRVLRPLPIRSVTPTTIDDWIAQMVANRNQYGKASIRTTFAAELKTLTAVLSYYAEYWDDPRFASPIRKRHRRDVKIRNRKESKRDLSEAELDVFLDALAEWGNDHHEDDPTYGDRLACMASVQYAHALRISEVAAIRWEDVKLDFENQPHSRLVITQHAIYLREKGARSFIEPGFKNGLLKEFPIDPRSFRAFAMLWRPDAKGLVFHNAGGNDPQRFAGDFLPYRTVQSAYDRTFRKLGMPYTSTHVMRHGGTRATLEESGGDRDVAAQQLGNVDRKTIDRYAVRSAAALTKFVARKWEQEADVKKVDPEPGITRYQTRPALRIVKEDRIDGE
jgi:integrase